MKKMYTVLLLVATIGLSSCTGQVTRGQSGAGIGAAGGALIGQAIGKSTEATLIGMAVGATLGYIVGNEMDKADRQQLNYAYESGVPDNRLPGRIPIVATDTPLSRNQLYRDRPDLAERQR